MANAVRRRARQKGTSLNKAVIDLLEEGLGVRRRAVSVYHELDSLAGSWVREEAEAFDAALREQRTIDPDLWR